MQIQSKKHPSGAKGGVRISTQFLNNHPKQMSYLRKMPSRHGRQNGPDSTKPKASAGSAEHNGCKTAIAKVPVKNVTHTKRTPIRTQQLYFFLFLFNQKGGLSPPLSQKHEIFTSTLAPKSWSCNAPPHRDVHHVYLGPTREVVAYLTPIYSKLS